MKRFAATFACDLRLQYRNGFYFAALVVTAAAALLLLQIPAGQQVQALTRLLPALIVHNLLVNTVFFVGGLVLLEKGEGTLAAQAATPLRPREYLGAKTATLLLLSLLENATLAWLVTEGQFSLPLLVAGVTAPAIFYTLAGFSLVIRFQSMNEYLLPSLLWATALALPLLPYFGVIDLPWVRALSYLHPLQPALVLLQAAFLPPPEVLSSTMDIIYGISAGYLWALAAAYVAVHAYRRFVVEGA